MSIYKMRTEFGHFLKPILFLIALVFLIGAIWSFGTAPGGKDRADQQSKDVIAEVNGIAITHADFDPTWEAAVRQAQNQGVRSPLQLADMKIRQFQEVVNSISTLNAAKEMGIDVSDRAVEEEVEKAVTEYLKQNRQSVLGEVSKEDEKRDPRRDSRYKKELASIGSSISQQEAFARSRMPLSQVRAQLAQKGILKKLEAEAKSVSQADVDASYNAYKIRVIALQAGSLPKEQLKNKADKILTAARSGEDFAKLARENSPAGDSSAGQQIDYSFEMSYMFPPDLSSAIAKMKAGDISPVIDTPDALFIVKVDSVTSKKPAKLEKKDLDERKKMIGQLRQMAAYGAVQQRVMKSQKVEVKDSEFLGYWNYIKAQQSFGKPEEQQKYQKAAIDALLKARLEKPSNYVAIAKLVQLQYEQGQIQEGIEILYPMLEGKNQVIDDAGLRILLGDMFLKKGEKDRAIAQYKEASEMATNDRATLELLASKFKEVGQPQLAAAQRELIADYDLRMKQFAERQKKAAPETPGAPPKE